MTPKIVFYLRLAGQTGRNRLQGVFAYLKDRKRNWDIRLPQTEDQFFAEIDDGADGVIVSSYHSQKAIRWAEQARCPVVFIDIAKTARRKYRAVDISINNDDGGFGLLAAQHLASLGRFASYGYVRTGSEPPPYWDLRREQGFVSGLRKRGLSASVFTGTGMDALGRWLKTLPKPAAIYASWDERARDIIRACRNERLHIPKQVIVLGTDDDEIICTLSSPKISSIRPDTEGEGYVAAQELDRQLRKTLRRTRQTILCKAKCVIDRESTKPPPPGKRLIDEALDLIKREHGLNVTPETIAAKLRCSRRILDLRFSEFHNETVGEALTRARLNHVCELLRTSGISITSIGSTCGFKNANALKNLFKRTFGKSMREYQKSVSS